MTLAIDFDGVIHAYSKGWQDGSIYDPPLPGAIEGLKTLMEQDSVFIFTTRPSGPVVAWLKGYGIPATDEHDGEFWNDRGILLVTDRKLPALAYLDDRAVHFTDWESALPLMEGVSR